MKAKMNDKMQAPRFFYSNVQPDFREIQEAAKQSSADAAMEAYLSGKADKLPEGMTPEGIVKSLRSCVTTFCDACDLDGKGTGITEDTCAEELKQMISGMEQDKAYIFLSGISAMMNLCNAAGYEDAGGTPPQVPSAEEMNEEIARVMAGAGDKDMGEWIDQLAEEICSSDMKAFVYGGGNEALIQALKDENFAQDMMAASAVDILSDASERADYYTMLACACYGQILDGNVEGVTPENANPEIIAALVSAGASKGTILQRLCRGEIDKELARDLLDKVEAALKWTLTKYVQVNMFLGLSVLAAEFVVNLLLGGVIGSTWGPALFVLGMMGSFALAGFAKDDISGLIGWLISLSESIVKLPFKVGKKIAGAITDRRKAAGPTPVEA